MLAHCISSLAAGDQRLCLTRLPVDPLFSTVLEVYPMNTPSIQPLGSKTTSCESEVNQLPEGSRSTIPLSQEGATAAERATLLALPDGGIAAQALAALKRLRRFLSDVQYQVLRIVSAGEECQHFGTLLLQLADRVQAMPKTYENRDNGVDSMVWLHYFAGGGDWYILEKDMRGDIDQAFGYAILSACEECAEFGYISIRELTSLGVELDLYFTPAPLSDVLARRADSHQQIPAADGAAAKPRQTL
jgi:hypothetical protein